VSVVCIARPEIIGGGIYNDESFPPHIFVHIDHRASVAW
jgi:hypothetical protein